MQINELINNSYKTAKSKGWWDDENRNIPELLALIHSEVSEALEEYRENGHEKKYYRKNDNKPEGFIYELADILIRVADMSAHYKLDLENALIEKMDFNKTRSYRHGNKKA
jgi:NTP pyrophosphatase (non-canonical NTP hydrolase)